MLTAEMNCYAIMLTFSVEIIATWSSRVETEAQLKKKKKVTQKEGRKQKNITFLNS